MPEKPFLSENNFTDPTVENPTQPTERTSVEIPHTPIPENPMQTNEPTIIEIPYESTQLPVTPAAPKK
jgi:hypothetical protein